MRAAYANAQPVAEDRETGAVVYSFCVERISYIGFSGKGKKAKWCYRFRDQERAAAYIAKFLADEKQKAAHRKELKDARNNTKRALQVGDVLSASWGYGQTNINYYQVIRLVGEKSVIIREIGKVMFKTSEQFSGTCAPMVDSFRDGSEEMQRRVIHGDAVNVSDCIYAAKKEKNAKGHYNSDYYSSGY